MKVLVVTNMYPNDKHPNYGVFVKTFCEQLAEIGIEYDLIKMNKETNTIKKVISYLTFFSSSFFKSLFGSYDYVYIHYVSISAMSVLLAKKIRRIKIIANAHGSDIVPQNENQLKQMKNAELCLKKADKIVVPSAYFKELILNKYSEKLNKNRIYIYPSGGINPQVFYEMESKQLTELYKKYGLNPEKKYFGYCGRIDQNKGIDTLLEAISLISDDSLRFLIVGSGTYENTMKRLIEKKKLNSRILCFGMMTHKNLNEIYNILHCFVFPTIHESLGLVAIEAMACGTPVIASDCSAPKYYIENNQNGLKFRVKDSVDFSSKIEVIANMNANEYSELKKGAINTSSKYYQSNIASTLGEIFFE